MPKKVIKSHPRDVATGNRASSWWSRYHNHLYGLATILGLLLTVVFYYTGNRPEAGPASAPGVLGSSSEGDSKQVSPPGRNDNSMPLADASEAQIARQAKEFSSISIEDYFKRWYKATDLQRDELEKEMLGKTVIWSGVIKTIEPGNEDGVRVVVMPEKEAVFNAFLDFDSSQRSEFLRLRQGQSIRFTCSFKSFVASPFLGACKLLRVLS